jgi:hydroxyacylglutathione hydrolase
MRLLLLVLFSSSLGAQTMPMHWGKLLKNFSGINQDVKCEPPLENTDKLDEESRRMADKKWYAGAPDCSKPEARTPAYEIMQVNPGFYILRQNKCLNFEAPFIYLYIGDDGAFLVDTGATHDSATNPLREIVDNILKQHPKGDELKLTVAHSHAHGDHVAGDDHFHDRKNTTVIGHDASDVAKAFNIKNWPDGIGEVDLGNRKLSIIPIPGHESSDIAIYDHVSGDLISGDSIYPGNIFLSKHSYPTYAASIKRLHDFSQRHPVRNILGAHVEMSDRPGVDYPYGSNYQPNEHRLPLRQEHLNELHQHLQQSPVPATKKFDSIILKL